MVDKNDYISLKRSDVAKAIKDWSIASYGMQLLAFICETRNLQLTVRADEVCELFNIKPRQLEKYGRERRIKSIVVGNMRIYDAFEVVRAVEEMHRVKRFRALNAISSKS